ncbi:MAG: class I SAM-dependent methyltransferase [Patescibacteria group bacterium]
MNHRELIISELKSLKFKSLLDVGCGEGCDIEQIHKEFPKVNLTGIDRRPERIEIAVEKLPDASLMVGDIRDLKYKGGSFDVVLSDATLYQNKPEEIIEILRKLRRIAKKYIFLIETHSEVKDDDERFAEYNVLNYKKMLSDLGMKNVEFIKITDKIWAGYPWSYWGHLIIVKL